MCRIGCQDLVQSCSDADSTALVSGQTEQRNERGPRADECTQVGTGRPSPRSLDEECAALRQLVVHQEEGKLHFPFAPHTKRSANPIKDLKVSERH